MKVLRKSKLFAAIVDNNRPDVPLEQDQQNPGEQMNSKDLLIEQMRLQRALLQTQRQRQQVQAQESRDRMRQIQSAQRIEQKKDEQESKNELKRRKLEVDEGAKNVGLYKTRSNPVSPVPMKR